MTAATRDALLALAEKCEAATGPERAIDGAIDRLMFERPTDGDYDDAERAIWRLNDGWSGILIRGDGFARGAFYAKEYTASLDAAMTLVPEGWGWLVSQPNEKAIASGLLKKDTPVMGEVQYGYDQRYTVAAATPALALTAAALRARAAMMGEGAE